MNQIRLGLFDIFGYLIPGVAHLILISLALGFIGSIPQLIMIIYALSLNAVLAYAFLGYVIGFIFEGIAIRYVSIILDNILGRLNDRVIKQFRSFHPESKIKSYDINMIYAYSDVNLSTSLEKADTFFAMGSLARNLSFAFLVFAILTIVRAIIQWNITNWFYVCLAAPSAIVLSVYLVFQADRFRKSSHIHLLNTYYVITEKGENMKRIRHIRKTSKDE